MSLQAFHSGLTTQMLADTGLIAWANTHFSTTLTLINGNTEVDLIDPTKLPVMVVELGDGELDFQIGGDRQEVEAEILVSFVWHEDQNASAFTQRLTLPAVVAASVSVDPTLNNAVDGAWLSQFSPDRNIIHPLHVFQFTVSGNFEETA